MKRGVRCSMILGAALATSHVWANNHTVTQKNKAFSTEELSVKAGDTVVFKNDDDTSHNVFSSTEGAKFNLCIQKAGVESAQKFDKPGTVEVRCAIHPKMKLKVTVAP